MPGHYALAAPYYCHHVADPPLSGSHRSRALSRLPSCGDPSVRRVRDAPRRVEEPCSESSAANGARRSPSGVAPVEEDRVPARQDREGLDAYVSGAFGLSSHSRSTSSRGSFVSTLTDDFYVYEEKAYRLKYRASGKTHRLGDPIRVKLSRSTRSSGASTSRRRRRAVAGARWRRAGLEP